MKPIRYWVRVLHRDIGYFLTGLVLIFCISGVAVNHIDSWNPSYSRTESVIAIGPLASADADGRERELIARVPLDRSEVRGRLTQGPKSFKVFLHEGGEVVVNPETGEGTLLRVERRAVLFDANLLHLNKLKKSWTFVSDAFAVLLAGLAVTGLFMLKGTNGLGGRGKWFVAGGLVVPAAYLIHYYATR